MYVLDAWSPLSWLGPVRLAVPALVMAAAIVIPGRRVAALPALALAVTVPLSGAVAGGLPLRAGWAALWLVVAITLHRGARAGMRRPVERAGGFESTLTGLVLGVPFFALMAVAVARQDLPLSATHMTTAGALYLTLGLIHLMVRRHILRAALGWGFAGVGLQAFQSATAVTLPATLAPHPAATLVGTAVALALVLRIGLQRARWAGSAWLSDAHDLHD